MWVLYLAMWVLHLAMWTLYVPLVGTILPYTLPSTVDMTGADRTHYGCQRVYVSKWDVVLRRRVTSDQ